MPLEQMEIYNTTLTRRVKMILTLPKWILKRIHFYVHQFWFSSTFKLLLIINWILIAQFRCLD